MFVLCLCLKVKEQIDWSLYITKQAATATY